MKKKNLDMDLDFGKIPPQAVDIEEVVLGAILIDKNALPRILSFIKSENFYKDSHQKIFDAILELYKHAEPIDILTVSNKLRNTNQLEDVGGAFYISQLTNKVNSGLNIEHHAQILKYKYVLREQIRIGSEMVNSAYSDGDPITIGENVLKGLERINESGSPTSYGIEEIALEIVERHKKIQSGEIKLNGIPSGHTELDRTTSGWNNSDLIIIAGRPGMGKTAVALDFILNCAEMGNPAAYFSLEMSKSQLVTRMISAKSSYSNLEIRNGRGDCSTIEEAAGHIMNLPIYIDDTPSLSIYEARAKLHYLITKYKIKIAVFDYLQLMRGDGDNREGEIASISRGLKGLAKEFNMPIIALAQLNRSCESTSDKIPALSHLRESGSIEMDADIVMFTYRPKYYNIPDPIKNIDPTDNLTWLLIQKHRNGSLNNIPLRNNDEMSLFTDWDYSNFTPNSNEQLNF